MPTAPPSHKPNRVQKSGWEKSHMGLSYIDRGYGKAWRKVRLQVIRRDKGLCQPCYRANRITAYRDVDHIIPKEQGGTDNPDNLQCICGNCHKAKTATERGCS